MKSFSILSLVLVAFIGVCAAEDAQVSAVKECLQKEGIMAKAECLGNVLKTEVKETGEKAKEKFDEFKGKAEGWFNQLKEKFENRQKRNSDIAWYPSGEEVAFAKQVKICLDMNSANTIQSCIEKVAAKQKPTGEIDPMRVETIVKYENVLNELREFFQFWKPGQSIKDALNKFYESKNQGQAGRRKRNSDIAWYPSGEEVAFAKQVKICLDMNSANTIQSCIEKVAAKQKPTGEIDPMRVETIVKYENVLNELREFFQFWKPGQSIKDSLNKFYEHKKQAQGGA